MVSIHLRDVDKIVGGELQGLHDQYFRIFRSQIGKSRLAPCSENIGLETTSMIVGAHSIIYSEDPEADRAFLRDVLQLPAVDAGGGWLIFGLPPAELAVHPSRKNDVHEFFLMCDDVAALIAEMKRRDVVCSPPETVAWGVLTHVSLPGGGKLGIYQPRHARPKAI